MTKTDQFSEVPILSITTYKRAVLFLVLMKFISLIQLRFMLVKKLAGS